MAESKSLAIKGILTGKNSRGAFAVKINSETMSTEGFYCIIKPGDELSSVDIYTPYQKLKEEILDYENQLGEDDQLYSVIVRIRSIFQEIPVEKIEKIINLYESSGDDYLKNILIRDLISEEIRKGYDELTGKIEIVVEEVQETEEQEGQDVEQSGEEKAEQAIIKVRPSLDPITGKMCSKLHLGDRVIVKAIDQEEFSIYGDRLTYLEEGDMKTAKLLADIIEIKTDEVENIKIMIRLGNNVFALLKVRADIKLGVYNPVSEEKEENEASAESIEKLDVFIVAMGALIIVLILIIGLLILF